jgi:asparagine synthase (glutamine-hydrolysing)
VAPAAPGGPHETADGSVAAAVNGEIWNHEDLRRDLAARGIAVPAGPDTAVVAPLFAAEGVAGLGRLRGMFAAAIHDLRDGSLVLARDRFGIKPLHWTPGPPVRFASEAPVLDGASGPDAGAVADFLALGVVPAPGTIESDVHQVEPGTAVVFRAGRSEVRRLARAPEPAQATTIDPRALLAALERAVARHRMGDLPLGVFVSGGVDSAVVAALLARDGPPPRLFALTFPGEGEFDEGPAARAVAAHLGLALSETPLRPGDVPELLASVVAAHGPFADSSALATHALCRAAAREVGVVVSGTGADELFAGYRRYRLGRVPTPLLAAARAAARVLPSSRRTRLGTLGALARKAARASGSDDAARYLETISVVPEDWRARLLGTDAAPPVLARFRRAFVPGRSFADAARAADFATYLPDDVLAKEDRAAASVSIENRVPFLDDEVADLAGGAAASAHLACAGIRGAKASLRAAAARLIPRTVRDRPKRGFAVPISEWMRGPLRPLVDSHLADPRALCAAQVDPRAVADLTAAHRSGDDDLGAAVWALVTLEAALRRRGAGRA